MLEDLKVAQKVVGMVVTMAVLKATELAVKLVLPMVDSTVGARAFLKVELMALKLVDWKVAMKAGGTVDE